MATLKDMLGCEPHEVPGRRPPEPHVRIAPQCLSAAGLRQLFTCPPVWEVEIRRERRWGAAAAPRAAAVLVPIVMRPEPTILLTQRTAHLPTHAGQIAFPGGKIDPHEVDAAAAALREAEEEVALSREWVEVIGTMPSYHTGSGFDITPVVALVQPNAQWQANPNEVAQVFEVPLAFVMDAGNHWQHEAQVLGETLQWWSMPYAEQGQTHYIWGATAAMLRNFYRMMVAAQPAKEGVLP